MIKRGTTIIIFLGILMLLVMPLASAGFFDWFKKITGYGTTEETVDINITIAAANFPNVTVVYNCTDLSTTGTNEGPVATYFVVNFTVYDEDGFANIDDSSATVNVSLAGVTPRINTTCGHVVDYDNKYANYTCNITMWWWDASGTWTINASISDNEAHLNENTSQTFYIGATDGFAASPNTLGWTGLVAGATDQEANEQIIMNNTGNINKWIHINATDLVGETNATQALWAGNFTVNNSAGCSGTQMVNITFTNITAASLPRGNYTINDESTGQEKIYFCIEEAGSELIAQSYSTAVYQDWTVKIVTV